jgi:hypothetical protein
MNGGFHPEGLIAIGLTEAAAAGYVIIVVGI